MKVLALVLIGLLGRFLVTEPAESPPPIVQQHTAHPRYVILDQHVKNVLARDWDAHAHDPAIVERAYCVTYQKDVWVIDEWVWRVVEIRPADDQQGQTPHSIQSFSCGDDPMVTTAHTHPAQSCVSDADCVNGGSLAMQCFPSDIDRQSLRQSGQPFALIQCSRDAVVSFEP